MYSVADGIVSYYADEGYGWGDVLMIRHEAPAYDPWDMPDGSNEEVVYSFYAHVTAPLVGIGEEVTQGQQIAVLGDGGGQFTAGNCSQYLLCAHLHFELRAGEDLLCNSYSGYVANAASCDDYHIDPAVFIPDNTSRTCQLLDLSVGCGNDYSDLQSAVNAAPGGSTIPICAGTYSGTTTIDGKTLILQGAGEGQTFLTAPVGDQIMLVINGADVTMTGLTIEDADCGSSACGLYVGQSAVALYDVTVQDITSTWFSGIYTSYSDVELHDVTIDNCHATLFAAGALTTLHGTITADGLSITNSSAVDYGGGLYAESGTITLTDATIEGNSAGTGGCMAVRSSTVSIDGGTVTNCDADYAGGIYAGGNTTMSLTDVEMASNEATNSWGGGLQLQPEYGAQDTTSVDITNCEFGAGADNNLPFDILVVDTNYDSEPYEFDGTYSLSCSVITGVCN